jgi:hypothetical protein
MTYGHNYKFIAENRAAAVKAAKEYAAKHDIKAYIVLNRYADVVYAQDGDGCEPPIQ